MPKPKKKKKKKKKKFLLETCSKINMKSTQRAEHRTGPKTRIGEHRSKPWKMGP
jgi:hypothetical protein